MKMRKFAALMLTLCMMLSLSISAFAASDTIASGTIPDSKIKWELDFAVRDRAAQQNQVGT